MGKLFAETPKRPCPECGLLVGEASVRYGGIERRTVTWWHCPMCNIQFDRREFSEVSR